MLSEFFTSRFEKNHHQNLLLFEGLKEHSEQLLGKCLRLASHIVNTHHIFISRLRSVLPESEEWDVFEPRDILLLDRANLRDTLTVMEENIFINLDLPPNSDLLMSQLHMLDHIILHSAYHRGQIVQILKQSNLSFPSFLVPIIV